MNKLHLYDLSSLLWGAVSQVLFIDCQHAVVTPQSAILGSQASLQEI